MNAAINWRSTLVSEKLHCADFVNNPSIITAVMQNYSHDQKLWYAPRITVFTVIVLLWFSCTPNLIFLHPYLLSCSMASAYYMQTSWPRDWCHSEEAVWRGLCIWHRDFAMFWCDLCICHLLLHVLIYYSLCPYLTTVALPQCFSHVQRRSGLLDTSQHWTCWSASSSSCWGFATRFSKLLKKILGKS